MKDNLCVQSPPFFRVAPPLHSRTMRFMTFFFHSSRASMPAHFCRRKFESWHICKVAQGTRHIGTRCGRERNEKSVQQSILHWNTFVQADPNLSLVLNLCVCCCLLFTVRLVVPSASKKGDVLLTADTMSKTFDGEKELFSGLTFTVG